MPRPSVDAETRRIDYESVVAVALDGLEEGEREVVVLFYFLGHSLPEIARMLRSKPGTVGKRLHSARLRIRRALPRAVRSDFMRLVPSQDFVERVRRGLLDEYVGEYRFERRPDHVVRIIRDGDSLISDSGGQRHVLVSGAKHSLVARHYDGEGRFSRNRHGEVTHFVYYEFGKRLGVARGSRPRRRTCDGPPPASLLASEPVNHGRPDVAVLAERWNATRGSVRHVRDGANAVFQFQAGGTRRFLRVTEDRHRNRQQLDAELDFVRFLASRGMGVACPVLSKRNAAVETVRTSDGRTWHAVVFAAAPGRHFRFFSPDIDRPLFQAWGSAMGRLHALSRAYVPAALRQRPAWTELDTTACADSMIPAAETAAGREYARVGSWLESLPRTQESWGLIHGDFERTNFVLDGATLRIYDFDDACYHWYLADMAHALWVFRRAPAVDRARFLGWFVEGYGQQCAVPNEVREYLSWFVRLRSLSLYLQRVGFSGACESDGRWRQQMRADFEKQFCW